MRITERALPQGRRAGKTKRARQRELRRHWALVAEALLARERAAKEPLQGEGSLGPWSNRIVDRNRAQGVPRSPVPKTKRPLAPTSPAGPAPAKTPSRRAAALTPVPRSRERSPGVAQRLMRKATGLVL